MLRTFHRPNAIAATAIALTAALAAVYITSRSPVAGRALCSGASVDVLTAPFRAFMGGSGRGADNPVGARVLRNTMANVALLRPDDRVKALGDAMSELLRVDENRKRFGAMMSGLDIHYDLGEGHPLLGRRMPDLDLVSSGGPLRVFALLHDARPVLLNLGEPGGLDITPWADRVQLIEAKYLGTWELPALGEVAAPTAVLIRPDGHVAWVGDLTQVGLADSLTTWFGPPAAA